MSQLLDHLNTIVDYGLWPRFQSAYCAHHSTETALFTNLESQTTSLPVMIVKCPFSLS